VVGPGFIYFFFLSSIDFFLTFNSHFPITIPLDKIRFQVHICFLFCVFCVFLYCFVHCAVSFLFLYKSTDHCHRVETQLQYINIISYRNKFTQLLCSATENISIHSVRQSRCFVCLKMEAGKVSESYFIKNYTMDKVTKKDYVSNLYLYLYVCSCHYIFNVVRYIYYDFLTNLTFMGPCIVIIF
jgi:hypothetical protein